MIRSLRIEVSSTAGVIDTETSTLSYAKDNNLLEQLAVVSRTAADVGIYGYVYTNPGVSRLGQGNPSVNGNSMLDTTLSLDGIVVMAYANGMGGGPTQPNLESVQEINVLLVGEGRKALRRCRGDSAGRSSSEGMLRGISGDVIEIKSTIRRSR
jgi:hypothetical protein